ncbi:MAG TPA: ABC transporter substrate-binding protein, partial [Longimicrobiaceae bacterium]|nr:ABC transporter substrate-binding protein [Longimicrobiaceae bacterium]
QKSGGAYSSMFTPDVGQLPSGTARRSSAALLVTLLVACGGGDAPEPIETGGDFHTISGGPPGGVLVALLDGEPDDLNPITYSSLPASQAIHLMFRSLAWRDSTLSNYRPDLATSWEVRDDSVVVLELRDDVRWHDGRPVTAEDVAFTIDRQRDPVVASPRQSDVAAVEEVTVIDGTTVEVRMRRTGAYAVNALLEVVPVPKHLLEDVEPARFRMAPFGSNPVGNGYFRFGRWERSQQLVLETNTERPEGRVALDRVVMRFVPDVNAALTELLAGQGDLLKISPEHRAQVERSSAVRLHGAPRIRPAWIAWNTTSPPVDDVRVRQAILMAVDREAIARGLFGEVGEAAYSPLPPALREHSEDVEPLPFDRDRAAQLLDAAGWRDADGDGIRERNGVPLRIQVDYNSAEQLRQDVLVAMQSMLRTIGVDLVPRAFERTAWVERLRGREFQGSSWGWGWGPGVVGPNAEAVFHTRSIPPAGANFGGYSNPRVDALIDQALATRDTGELQRVWREFEQIVIDEVPYAPIYLDPELFAVNSRFQNVEFRGIEWWEDVPFWHVPLEARLPRDRTR